MGMSLQTALPLQGGLFLLVASIPFEYPGRSIPLEIPTLTAAVFLFVTLLYPTRSYSRIPAAAIWFGVYLLAFLLSILVGSREYAAEALSEFVIMLQAVLVFLAAANLMQDEKVARRALFTLAAACSLRAVLPFLGLGRTSDAVGTGGDRISALGQNANSAAMILAAGLLVVIGLTLMRRDRSVRSVALAAAVSILLGFAILETGSRGGFAALLGGVLVFALAASTWQQRLRNGALALLAVSLLVISALNLPVMKNRLLDAAATGNLAGREQLYPALWTMFLEKPVMGWGPVNNTYELAARVGERTRPKRSTHNLLLELTTAGGLMTTMPFIIGAWLCVQSAWRARSGGHGVLPLALLCSLFLSNMSGDWGGSKLLWVMLAYALVSGTWPSAPRWPLPLRSRRWIMTSPFGVRS
jgi:O-antigen ligase